MTVSLVKRKHQWTFLSQTRDRCSDVLEKTNTENVEKKINQAVMATSHMMISLHNNNGKGAKKSKEKTIQVAVKFL